MVNVVVNGVVGEKELEGVPWETVAAVVVNGLHGSKHIDEERLTRGELGDDTGDTSADGV